jgi:nitrogen fixation NifU-like protein
MSLNYTDKVMKHFKNPKFLGEIKNPDGIGMVGNPRCGDVMHIYIKVKEGRIADIKVKTFGCVAAISTSDVVCGLALGKTLDEAVRITKDDVIKKLGMLPPEKIHCSLLGLDALKMAVDDYGRRKPAKH